MRDEAAGLSRYRRKLRRLERRLAFPSTLNVESTNYCNLKCPMCARTTSMSRPLQHMESTLFEAIAAEAGTHGIDTMWLHVFGEPLLHPRIFEFVRTARQYPAIRTVALSTNGTVLDGSRTEELLASGIDAVLLAIDATTEGTYRIVRNGGSFARTLANAERFLEEHERRGSGIRVDVSIIEMPLNRSEVPAFRARWARFEQEGVVRVIRKTLVNFGGQAEILPEAERRDATRGCAPCRKLWNSLTVLSDGRVVACCYDVNGSLEYGRIPATTLKAIWDGPAVTALRERHWNLDFEGLPLCRSCDSIVPKSEKEERGAGSPARAEPR